MTTQHNAFSVLTLAALALSAQQDSVPLKHWSAPLYWQPSADEQDAIHKSGAERAATTPIGALVFVGITPCRLVDTRNANGPYGGPIIPAGGTRTFEVRNGSCSIPATAQAYSFNVTAVPPGFLGFLTVYPTGVALPGASTLNAQQGQVVANAAIVPAGTNGSVDVFANNTTHVILDINGYYAPPSGLTLAQGSAVAPSLSFSGDAGTGIYSSAAGTLNFTAGGTNRLTVRADGDLDLVGNVRKSGNLFLHNQGTDNTALGIGGLAFNTTGIENAATGVWGLHANSTGSWNTATGAYAMLANTTGSRNTANGNKALSSNTLGYDNTAIGYQALLNNNSAQNTAVGASALENSTDGSGNTALGADALTLATTGGGNTAVGWAALALNKTGNSNVGVGYGALNANNGSNNIALGNNAGSDIVSGSNNIEIGNIGVDVDNNNIRIGNSTHRRFFAAGVRGVTPIVAGPIAVVVDSNGQLGTVSSSRRFKEDIHDMGEYSTGLLRLRPVSFRYKQPYEDGSKPLDSGLIAEEVAEVYPDLVVRDKNGEVETVQYHKLTSMLVNELQKLKKENGGLKSEVDELKDELRSRTDSMAAELASLKALLQR